MQCTGNGAQHCCWVSGVVCPFLADRGTDAPRRWVCTIREEYNSWDEAVNDPRYRLIGTYWQSIGAPFNYCQTYKPTSTCCGGDD